MAKPKELQSVAKSKEPQSVAKPKEPQSVARPKYPEPVKPTEPDVRQVAESSELRTSPVLLVKEPDQAQAQTETQTQTQVQAQDDGDVEQLQAQYQNLLDGMLAEGLLDEQFSQLQMLQDENTPGFVDEVVTLFFDDSVKLLENLTQSLKRDPMDYKLVDGYAHQLKGSSSSIGAQRVKQVCITFRHCCDKEDKQGCLDNLVKVKQEFNTIRSKLGKILELERKIVELGGVLP